MIQSFIKTYARTVAFVLALFMVSPVAFSQTDSNQENETKVKAKVSKNETKTKDAKANNPTLANLQGGGSGWRLQGSMTHTPKLRRDQEDTTDFLFRADYNFNKSHSIRLQQFFTKFYGKYASEYEFKPFDTTVGHFYRLPWKPGGVGLQVRNTFSLPISNESRRDDLQTTYQLSVLGSKSLLGGKMLLFGIPYGRYFFREYNTSISGRPLPRYQYGASYGALYFWTPKLSTYVGGDYRVERVYFSQFDQNRKQIPQGIYRFDVDMSYQWTNHLTTSLSYAQGWASFIQGGRYELAFFDDQVSRYSVGLTYIY